MTVIYHFKKHIYATYGQKYDGLSYHARGRFDAIDHALRYCCCGEDVSPKDFAHMINLMVEGPLGFTPKSNYAIEAKHIHMGNAVLREEDDPYRRQPGLLEAEHLRENGIFDTYSNEYERLTWKRVHEGGWGSVDGSYFKTLGFRRANRAYKIAVNEVRPTKPIGVDAARSYVSLSPQEQHSELRRIEREIRSLQTVLEGVTVVTKKGKQEMMRFLLGERKRMLVVMGIADTG